MWAWDELLWRTLVELAGYINLGRSVARERGRR
jgi:hypothetical protein